MDVVGEVIEIEQPCARGVRISLAQPLELGVIGRAFRAVAVDEIQQAPADALDGGNIERLLLGRDLGGLGTQRDRALIGFDGIDHAKRHRRSAWPVRGDKVEAVRAGLLIDEIVDIALAINRDLLAAVERDRDIAHQLEQRVQLFRLGVRIFDELETIGAHRVVGADGGGRRVVRKRTHGESPRIDGTELPSYRPQSACKTRLSVPECRTICA